MGKNTVILSVCAYLVLIQGVWSQCGSECYDILDALGMARDVAGQVSRAFQLRPGFVPSNVYNELCKLAGGSFDFADCIDGWPDCPSLPGFSEAIKNICNQGTAEYERHQPCLGDDENAGWTDRCLRTRNEDLVKGQNWCTKTNDALGCLRVSAETFCEDDSATVAYQDAFFRRAFQPEADQENSCTLDTTPDYRCTTLDYQQCISFFLNIQLDLDSNGVPIPFKTGVDIDSFCSDLEQYEECINFDTQCDIPEDRNTIYGIVDAFDNICRFSRNNYTLYGNCLGSPSNIGNTQDCISSFYADLTNANYCDRLSELMICLFLSAEPVCSEEAAAYQEEIYRRLLNRQAYRFNCPGATLPIPRGPTRTNSAGRLVGSVFTVLVSCVLLLKNLV